MRRWFDRLFILCTGACVVFALSVMAFIVVSIVWHGGGAISWEFLTDQIRSVGAEGGIFYNIMGTFILLVTALIVTVPLATGLALVHGVYLKKEKAKERLWLLLSVLNGVPSILLGLFGLIVFVKFT